MADDLRDPDPAANDFEFTPSRRDFLGLTLAAGSGALLWPLFAPFAQAQRSGVFCAAVTGKELVNPGEIVSANGVLQGLIDLGVETRNVTYYQRDGAYVCFRPTLRAYQGYQGWTLDPKKRVTLTGVTAPGPTLRAKVGDSIQLIFLNRIDQAQFQQTALTSIKSAPNKCDTVLNTDGSERYPTTDADKFPNCFHASNTSNLHFHGTHTNPDNFGDNVLVGVLPDPKLDTAAAFDKAIRAYGQWSTGQNPTKWLIEDAMQRLKVMHAAAVEAKNDVLAQQIQDALHTNETNLAAGEFPQYWPGFFPNFFNLPHWSGSLQKYPRMGQSPGTHWYHCHQHGSTALQLINGMAGLFIITGDYDDKILRIGGGTPDNPKIKEKVLIFQIFGEQPQQVQSSPSTDTITVNGQALPTITMKRGEVQWWRIGDAAMKAHGVGSFIFLDQDTYDDFVKNPDKIGVKPDYPKKDAGPPTCGPGTPSLPTTMAKLPAPNEAKVPHFYQTAQDGVQFHWTNFQRFSNKVSTQQAPGNRGDFLVKAPDTDGTSYLVFWFAEGGPPVPRGSNGKIDLRKNVVLKVVTAGAPDENTNTSLPTEKEYPEQPGFLADITDEEIQGKHRTVTFSMHGGIGSLPTFKIDGEQFNEGEIDQLMLLGTAEEWTLVNYSGRSIQHPFHIHINPFQVTEIFDPLTMKEPLKFEPPYIWWDVIPIPAGVQKQDDQGNFCFDEKTNLPILVGPPGHVKMRSRFVDFPGTFVLHCHILGHEDRGMMQLVKVMDNKTVVKHH